MSLNFNFAKVADYQSVTTNPANPDEWHPVADALVWLSMICGYHEITLKNVDTVIARIMAYQAVTGAFLFKVYIMPADIRRFVGMTTNASVMTDAQWERRLGQIATDQGKYLQRRLEDAQTPTALSEVQRIWDDAQQKAA